MQQNMLAIIGGRLISGTGNPPIQNSTVLIQGNRILEVGQQDDIKLPSNTRIINANKLTVMPGLIDLSVRFSKLGHLYHDTWEENYRDRLREEVIPLAAEIVLKAGVTTARNIGGNFTDMLWLRAEISSGRLQGPRLFICGAGLRKTESKRSYYSYELVRNLNKAHISIQKLVEHEVDVIKILAEEFEEDELAAIVNEAHRHHKSVDVSVHSIATMQQILNTGIRQSDTLFHFGVTLNASEFPSNIIEKVLETGVGVIPTIIAGDALRQIVVNPEIRDDPYWQESMPSDIWEDIYQSYAATTEHSLYEMSISTHHARLSRINQLKKAGVRLDFGTDSGIRGNPHHAAAWREMVEFRHFGMSPSEIIQAATSKAAQILGKESELGTVEAGKLADIILIDGNPLEDISLMKNVVHVIQDGNIIY